MIIKEVLETKVKAEYDVLVCGGGFGGIAAALAAARQGKRVALIEKLYMLGGLGTAGLVTIYLPICDGMGHQVSFGICEELFRLSISMGAEDRYPENWLDSDDIAKRTENDKRFEVQYNPNIFAILAEQLLIDNGVDIMYGTYAVATSVCDNKINAVIVENKSGRFAIECKSVVDSTGDCDIAVFSGAPTKLHEAGNILAAWYYSLENSGYKLNMLGYCEGAEDAQSDNSRTLDSNQRYSGVDGKDITEFVINSHSSILNSIESKRKTDQIVVPTMIATTPQFRMTRKLVGEYTLDITEEHKYFEDSIGMVSDWRYRGPVFEVPFKSLYSAKVKNLICAGRCTSTTDEMWDVMRVIPCCAVTGEAAGIAAAMTDDFTSIDINKLQNRLTSNGVILHECDL